MASIAIENIDAAYGSTPVLSGVDLVIASGELHTLLGRSGCGKTTLLRLVAGFLAPTSGRIVVDGRDISGLPPEKRHMGVVFQSYALFPRMTVAQNIAYGLRVAHVPKAQRIQIVDDLVELLDLGEVRNRSAQELSGGQQQRVAIGRALMNNPAIVLADEPTGNLDTQNSREIMALLESANRDAGQTLVVITHDEDIALSADRIIAIEDGRIVSDERIRA